MIGPLMLDLEGMDLTEAEIELLANPYVGGVILFSRNVSTPEQVEALTQSIREINPDLLIAVDQEGGRVQRLKLGFTQLPPMNILGQRYDIDPDAARRLAETMGWLMATEVLSVGIDFSFAPVLDLDYGISSVIGDRALHRDPLVATDLAQLFVYGMKQAGMSAVIKHFPGHGAVAADSHLALPIDSRDIATILQHDMIPFQRLVDSGAEGVMPAHIVFPDVDSLPVGFSSLWLQHYLRQQLNFQGVIFSDDLTMEGAAGMGNFSERAEKALVAGCDMILVCNHRNGVLEVLDYLATHVPLKINQRLSQMRGAKKLSQAILQDNPNWQQAKTVIEGINL